MEAFFVPALAGLGAVCLVRLLFVPVRAFGKWGISAACGFGCLWLLNLSAPVTGVGVPLNAITVAVAGALGLPGIAALAVLAVL